MNVKRAAWIVVAAAAVAACAPKQVKTGNDQAKNAAAAAPAAPINPPGVDTTEASIRGGEFQSVDGIDPIYFEYDSATLSAKALDTLKANADYLKAHPDLDALVAGNCDERGTIEYNLALGQRRAKEVRDYYLRLGIPGKQVATISYGKEKPVCTEANEACWSKNRRADTKVRATLAKSSPAPTDASAPSAAPAPTSAQ